MQDRTAEKFRVLVVDDDQRTVKFLSIKLKASGYEVLTANSGLEALELVHMQEPDLIVLDLIMPGIDGFETLKQIRALSSVPVIILSAKEAAIYKISALEMGADDYLAKPFDLSELVARIEAVRRRLAPIQSRKMIGSFTLGHITISVKKHLVIVDDEEIPLSRIEWLLLTELARNAGKLMVHEELLARIWGPEYRDDIKILRTWISLLRKKIERDPHRPEIIRTVPKTGYMVDQLLS